MSNLDANILREIMRNFKPKQTGFDHTFPRMQPEGRSPLQSGISTYTTDKVKKSQINEIQTLTVSYKTMLPISPMDIQISEFVPLKKIYLRPLKRKSSRRWQKKWKKRGWITEVEQVLKIGNKLIMSRKMYTRMMEKISEGLNKSIEKQTLEMIYGN